MAETAGYAALIEEAAERVRVKNMTQGVREEISELVLAAIADMNRQGIDTERLCPDSATVSGMKPLAVRAVMLYVKAHFGVGGSDSEAMRYQTCYDSLVASMSLTAEYMKGGADNAGYGV